MKLLIRQRVFSWTDSYDVYDENGNVKYFVKAEFLSIGHQQEILMHMQYRMNFSLVMQCLKK